MFRGFVSEAISLLAEALLGKPATASAGCPRTECTDCAYDACNYQCPYNQRKCHQFCRQVDPCAGEITPWYDNTHCVYCP